MRGLRLYGKSRSCPSPSAEKKSFKASGHSSSAFCLRNGSPLDWWSSLTLQKTFDATCQDSVFEGAHGHIRGDACRRGHGSRKVSEHTAISSSFQTAPPTTFAPLPVSFFTDAEAVGTF